MEGLLDDRGIEKFRDKRMEVCAYCGEVTVGEFVWWGDKKICLTHVLNNEKINIEINIGHYAAALLRINDLERKLKLMQYLSKVDDEISLLKDGMKDAIKDSTNSNKTYHDDICGIMGTMDKEMQSLRSAIDRNNDFVSGMKSEIGSIRNEVKQAFDSQKATTSEITKTVNEKTDKLIEELKASILHSNVSGRVDLISKNLDKLTAELSEMKSDSEVDADVWGDNFQSIDSKLDKLLTPKVPEPAKVEEPKKEEMKEAPAKPEAEENIDEKANTVLKALSTWKSIKEVSEETGIENRSVRRRVEVLIEVDKIQAKGENPTKYMVKTQ